MAKYRKIDKSGNRSAVFCVGPSGSEDSISCERTLTSPFSESVLAFNSKWMGQSKEGSYLNEGYEHVHCLVTSSFRECELDRLFLKTFR